MYAFGDSNPQPDTINVMEELLIEHITDVCTQAQRVASNKGKVKVDDFKFALRTDHKKLSRVEELLYMQEVIARARSQRDDLATFAQEEAEEEKRREQQQTTSTSAAGGGLSLPGKGRGRPPKNAQ